MKFTHNWLKDFVDVKIPAEELARQLTMAGLEVTSLEKIDNDWVYEVEITSNRADLLSVIGIAREAAAITNSKLKTQNSKPKTLKKEARCSLKLKIQDKNDCPLYTAQIIKGVTVDSSPDWIKRRLELVGVRPVNNIVDITNYVQLCLGQPLHAFNLDRIAGDTVFVRRARGGEVILTIANEEKVLDKEVIVIADNKRTIAIAGIVGGKDTEVNADTKNILLESAKFNPLMIRRARQRMGISTDSSYRFERDVDINSVGPAALYAVQLILKTAQGRYCDSKTTTFVKTKNKGVSLNAADVQRILGVRVPGESIKRVLKGLGFKIKKASMKNIIVEAPSFRRDIRQEIDLIEEIARLWGYERIPLSMPSIKPSLLQSPHSGLLGPLRQILISQGLSEVITYSLISKDTLNKVGLDSRQAIEIVNPLSGQQEVLRPKLFPSLLGCVGKNINLEEAVAIFEIANVFGENRESFVLGIALCGDRWVYLSSGRQKDSLSIFHLKGIIELVLTKLGLKEYDFILKDEVYFQNGQLINIKAKGKDMGCFGQISKELGEHFDIKDKPVFLAELYLDEIFALAATRKIFKPLPLYPSVQRDISLLIKEDASVKDILNAITELNATLLKDVKVIDYYRGKQVPGGFKGATLSCVYSSEERTLTDTEVNSVDLKIRDLLRQKFQVQIR